MGRIFKRGDVYYIDVSYKGIRIRKAAGKDKKSAEKIMKKVEVDLIEGKFFDIKKEEKIKFSEMAHEFLEVYSKVNKKSWLRDQLSIKHLNRFLGNKYLSEITGKDIEDYKRKRLEEGVKPATVNRELTCLKTILNKAVEWKKLNTLPPKIKLFKEDNKRVRYLTREEIKKIIENSPQPLRDIILVALNTGMRLGEILNLRFEDIDFINRLIYVREGKGGKREIPMNEIVYDILWNRKFDENMNLRHGEYVFGGISKYSVSHKFNGLMKKLNIQDFRFHDLRHTFASYLAMMGVSLKVIQELLGHKSLNMTLRYSHLSPDYKKEVVENYGDFVGFGTNMAQRENLENFSKKGKIDKILSINNFDENSRDGGKEDATDLKSVGALAP